MSDSALHIVDVDVSGCRLVMLLGLVWGSLTRWPPPAGASTMLGAGVQVGQGRNMFHGGESGLPDVLCPRCGFRATATDRERYAL